ERFRAGGAQLHAPQSIDPDGADACTEPDGVSEDAGRQRLLFRLRRLGFAARTDSDVRNFTRRADPGRDAAAVVELAAKGPFRGHGPAFDGFLAVQRRPAAR